MARSLNKAELIGNLTRDPELRYTPTGAAVCTFGVATNRQWTTDSGEKKDEAEFHKIVAWNKLAELCAQLLTKGRKVYVEGRLQTRKWTGQDGQEHSTTEIVISDMVILDSRVGGTPGASPTDDFDIPDETLPEESKGVTTEVSKAETKAVPEKKSKAETKAKKTEDTPSDDDIPF